MDSAGPERASAARHGTSILDGTATRGGVMGSASLAKELWAFMRMRKKWWLLPILAVMLLVGALLVFAQGSVLAPFIYTIF